MNLKVSVMFILVAMSLIFIGQNLEIVDVRFLIWHFSISRAMLVILLLLVGFVVGWLLRSYFRNR